MGELVKRPNLIGAYVALVGVPLLALLGVLRTGSRLTAPPFVNSSGHVASDVNTHAAGPDLFILVAQIAVIILASRAVGYLFQKMAQPQVIGEMLAGIMLG